MTVHYLKSGCIGKYMPLGPWDFPRAVVLGPRWMHFPIYPSSPQCFNLFCINMLSLPDYWFHNYFFKQLTIKSIRLTKIFLVCVGLGLYGDQTFGLYGDQTVPSKEGLLAPPRGLLPVPCLLTNFDRFSIGGCRGESILKRGKGNVPFFTAKSWLHFAKLDDGRQQIKSNIGRRGNFHWKQVVANQSCGKLWPIKGKIQIRILWKHLEVLKN